MPNVASAIPSISCQSTESRRSSKERRLKNLYSAQLEQLGNAHAALDSAVVDAYGWRDDWRAGVLIDDEILARLYALNQECAGKA